MKKVVSVLKNYFYIISVSIAVGLISSYILGRFFAYKVNEESMGITLRTHYINQLKDRYMLCMLDYQLNPNGQDNLRDCKIIETKIKLSIEELREEAPYYTFYKDYFEYH